MSLTKREAIDLRRLARAAAVAVAVGLGFGIMAPFETGRLAGWMARLCYWQMAILLPWVQISAAMTLARSAPFAQGWSPLRLGIAVVLATAVPITAELALLNTAILGSPIDRPEDGLWLLGAELVVSAMITLPALAIARQTPQPAPSPTPSPLPSPLPSPPPSPLPLAPLAAVAVPGFARRIPASLGGSLLALEMEDHYLRVHTTAGSALILMRLSDALVELAGFDGLQVHRSWYVARAAVISLQREGQRLSLILVNQMRVPVSRTHMKTVLAALQRDA